jgi:hypothetical protein
MRSRDAVSQLDACFAHCLTQRRSALPANSQNANPHGETRPAKIRLTERVCSKDPNELLLLRSYIRLLRSSKTPAPAQYSARLGNDVRPVNMLIDTWQRNATGTLCNGRPSSLAMCALTFKWEYRGMLVVVKGPGNFGQ